MYGYIYKVTNKLNNKIYVGKKKSEIFLGEAYLGSGVIIKQSIKKNGKENFMVTLLEECDTKEYLNQREKWWIEYLNATDPNVGYNIAPGGDGGVVWKEGEHPTEGKKRRGLIGPENGMYGKHFSEESKQKASETHKRLWAECPKFRIIKDGKVKYSTEEDFIKWKEEGWEKQRKPKPPKKPFKHTEEAKAKIGAAHRGQKITEERINKFKKTMANKTDEEKRLISQHRSESHLGKSQSDSSNLKRSETMKKKYAAGEIKICPYVGKWNKGHKDNPEQLLRKSLNMKGRIWIHKEAECKMIWPEELDNYLIQGYVTGRIINKRKKDKK